MELFNSIWGYVIPIGGGLTVGALVGAIIVVIGKSAINKLIAKANIGATEKKAVDEGIKQLKAVSFKQTIQPIAESELKKITETANKYISDKLDAVEKKYAQLVDVLEKLSAYFDNSIGVSEEKKAELHTALENAKIDTTPSEIEIVVEDSGEMAQSGLVSDMVDNTAKVDR